MKTIAQLRTERGVKIDAFSALVKKMNADGYVDDSADDTAYKTLKTEIEGLDGKISRAVEDERLQASLARPVNTPTPEATPGVEVIRSKLYGTLQAYTPKNLNVTAPVALEQAYAVAKWFLATQFSNAEAQQWCREHGIPMQRAASESVNSSGGFLVPTPLMDALIVLREQFGVFRREAQLVPMSSDTLNWPRQTGALTAYFVGENTAPTESNQTFDNIALVAKKLGILTRISTELNEDAMISMADIMTRDIAYGFASKEDDCGFNGDGSVTYGGIIGATVGLLQTGHGGSKVSATSGHDLFSEIDVTDITQLMAKLPAYALPNAKFYCSQFAFASVFERLIATAGGNSIATLNGEIVYRYLGYPIVISQKLPAVGTTLANVIMLMFGDMRMAAAVGERRVATLRRLDERYADQDQIGFAAFERVDINVHDIGDATNAGPLVGLMGN